MLTTEQKAIRLTGIGASEVSAIVELNPYKLPIDIWLRKPTRSRAPIVVDEDADIEKRAEVGDALEDALRALYTKRTKRRVAKPAVEQATRRHKDFACILASADALAVDEDRGLEIKVVGSRMAHHWADDSIPDYVIAQAVQGMAVYDRPAWDVAALIGGTDFRIETIQRDLELEESIIGAACEWWATHIDGDEPPPAPDPAARKRYLQARYPGSDKAPCRRVDTEEAAALATMLVGVKARAEEIELEEAAIVAELCELVGDDYGIDGPWGRAFWIPSRGAPAWKAIAEELAGGSVPADIIEKHRGEGFRSFRYYPFKEPKERKRR